MVEKRYRKFAFLVVFLSLPPFVLFFRFLGLSVVFCSRSYKSQYAGFYSKNVTHQKLTRIFSFKKKQRKKKQMDENRVPEINFLQITIFHFFLGRYLKKMKMKSKRLITRRKDVLKLP